MILQSNLPLISTYIRDPAALLTLLAFLLDFVLNAIYGFKIGIE